MYSSRTWKLNIYRSIDLFGSVDGDEDLDTAITTVQEKTNDELLAVSILKDTM